MSGFVDLFGPATPDLDALETALKAEIEGDPEVVSGPIGDLFAAGGKRIRPALVFLAARGGQFDRGRVLPAAMAVELTHTATLVHDDVIDRSATRRGRPTVSARLGDEPAIVIGDFYFAKSYELASRTGMPEVVSILARTVMDICAGEVSQQAVRYRYTTGVDEYMRRIEAKTATLLAACCEIGALLGGLTAADRIALRRYGRELGLAFQIADDVLDYTGTSEEIGKPTGHDVFEGFATLPLMLAMRDESTRAVLRKTLIDGTRLDDEASAAVRKAVIDSSGPREALAQAESHADAARQVLSALTARAMIPTLASLAGYVVSRKL